jgi:hypothetical protein
MMRGIGSGVFYAGVAAIGLLGCVDASGAQERRTLDEAEFLEEIVGARLVWEGGETRYSADGTFTGLTGGKVLMGEWEYKNGKFCRSGSVDGDRFPYACEKVTIAGKTLTFSGTGTTYVYTIKK